MKPKWWQLVKRFKAWRRKGSITRTDIDSRAELTAVTNFAELVAVATKERHSPENVPIHPEPKFWSNFFSGDGNIFSVWCLFSEDIRPKNVDGVNGLQGGLVIIVTTLGGVVLHVFTFILLLISFAHNGWNPVLCTPFGIWWVMHLIPAIFAWRKDVREVREKNISQGKSEMLGSTVVNERILAFIKEKIEAHKNAALGEQSRITALFAKIELGLVKITQLQARYREREKGNPTKWEPKVRILSEFEGRFKNQRESLTRQKDALLKFFATCETTLNPLKVQLEERLDAEEIKAIGREIAELETEVPTIGFETVREIITDFVRLNGALETAGSIAGRIGGEDFDLIDAVEREPVVLDALSRLQLELLPPVLADMT